MDNTAPSYSRHFSLLQNTQLKNMIFHQISIYSQCSQEILNAFAAVPMHLFVADEHENVAYSDQELPVDSDSNRKLLKPEVYAKLLHYADLKSTDRVLNIACGTGYLSILLGLICKDVVGIDNEIALINRASLLARTLGALNVEYLCGDLTLPERPFVGEQMFDVIIISGSVTEELLHLFEINLLQSLRREGRLVFIKDDKCLMNICRYYKAYDKRHKFNEKSMYESVYASPIFPDSLQDIAG